MAAIQVAVDSLAEAAEVVATTTTHPSLRHKWAILLRLHSDHLAINLVVPWLLLSKVRVGLNSLTRRTKLPAVQASPIRFLVAPCLGHPT